MNNPSRLPWIQRKCVHTLMLLNLGVGLNVLFTRCTPTSSLVPATTTTSPTPSVSATTMGGAKAVRILFTQNSSGSFVTAPGGGGTVNAVGQGLHATQVFNPDGTVLASGGYGSTNWPPWLSSFEIGISGASNTHALNAQCATFALSTESSTANCNIPTTPATVKCGAPAGYFRVSEADCVLGAGPAQSGTGGPDDGIYLRAIFNRSALGTAENMLVILEFLTSTVNGAPANPTACFSSGSFAPEACSDFVWQAYIKHSASDTYPLPFLMLAPPMVSSILPGNQTPGTNPTTRQIMIPLAADASITVLQISRISGTASGSLSNLQSFCTASNSMASAANSALCAGTVFYSITFYRI